MSEIFERVLLLKSLPMFSGVETEDLRVVAYVLQEEIFFKGERIFEIGDQGDHMYVIQSGRVGISIHPDPTRQEFVVERGESDCFGEMGILDEQPRSATVHVIEDTLTLALGRAQLHELITRCPPLALGMLRSISEKLREATLKMNGKS